MNTVDTADIYQFPVDRDGHRDIAIIGTISNDQPGYAFRRVDGFFIPTDSADRNDYVYHQHHGQDTDLAWIVEVIKQSLLRIWKEKQAAAGGLPVPGAVLSLTKASTEEIGALRALVALDYYKALSGVRGMAEVPSTLACVNALLAGRLYSPITQIHPRLD